MSQGLARVIRPAWILNSGSDLLFFIATPLLIIPAVAFSNLHYSAEVIGLFVAAVGATGHHLPGMMRAYGDRELFRRFWVRFTVAPIFLLATCLYFSHFHLNGLRVIVFTWGFWHALAQVYGFARIYDAKVGPASPVRSWIDWLMCIAWFGAGLLHSPGDLSRMFDAFYDAGGPFLTAASLQGVIFIWDLGTAVVTAAFLANMFRDWQRGAPLSLAKLLVMTSSFACWWYTLIGINEIILGVAIFEIFHDVQYLAIVWVYNRNRISQGHRVGRFTRWLFRRSSIMMVVYVALVFAYGGINFIAGGIDQQFIKLSLYGFLTASTFLHFYYDGFIWKVRERSIREGLGMSGGDRESQQTPTVPGWLPHGAKWAGFVIPVLLLATAQTRSETTPLERAEAVTASVPESARARVALATELVKKNRLADAKVHLERALAIDPENMSGHAKLGQVYLLMLAMAQMQGETTSLEGDQNGTSEWTDTIFAQMQTETTSLEGAETLIASVPVLATAPKTSAEEALKGDWLTEARRHLERALAIDPENMAAHSNLGQVLRIGGKLSEAKTHCLHALRLKPNDPVLHNDLGVVLEELGELAEARQQYEHAVRLKPNYASAHRRLGGVLHEQGELETAHEQLALAVRLDPGDAQAHYRLGNLLGQTGNLEGARASFERALSIDPGDVTAQHDLGFVLATQGNLTQAKDHFERAVQIDADFTSAHYSLAVVLAQSGDPAAAINHYREALQLDPNLTLAAKNLALLLATCEQPALRDPQQAVRLAEQAADATSYNDPAVLEALAVSYASAGQFNRAVETTTKAIEVCISRGFTDSVPGLQERLHRYQQGQP